MRFRAVNISNTPIILNDRNLIAELMIRYSIAAQTQRSMTVGEVDGEYFE
ncbi:hypothetical protein [Nocardia inohanensis]|nr:hypothetical protein [Nocardia inohanensis]